MILSGCCKIRNETVQGQFGQGLMQFGIVESVLGRGLELDGFYNLFQPQNSGILSELIRELLCCL